MDVRGMFVDRSSEYGGSQLGVLAQQRNQLCATSEELRCPALIDADVAFLVYVHCAPRWAQRSEAQRVGGSAGGDRKYPHLRAEELSQDLIESLRPWVIAVGNGVSLVGFREGRQNFRSRGGCIVTVETQIAPQS